MYTVQYKFFFGFFFQFFFKAVDSQCHSVTNALKRAVFVRIVDEDEMEDEG